MAVPKDVLAVPRPRGTRVYCYGKNNDKYGVRKVLDSRMAGDGFAPRCGKTVGHIVNLKYVPIDTGTKHNAWHSSIYIKYWAEFELCDMLLRDMLDELSE